VNVTTLRSPYVIVIPSVVCLSVKSFEKATHMVELLNFSTIFLQHLTA